MGPRADRGAHGPLGHTAYWANGLHIEVDRGGPRGPDVGLQDDMQDTVRSPVRWASRHCAAIIFFLGGV